MGAALGFEEVRLNNHAGRCRVNSNEGPAWPERAGWESNRSCEGAARDQAGEHMAYSAHLSGFSWTRSAPAKERCIWSHAFAASSGLAKLAHILVSPSIPIRLSETSTACP